MTWLDIARAAHLIAVAHWIGGVAFVTLVIMPLARSTRNAEQRLALFEGVERRFAGQARVSVMIAGLSGFYLLEGFGGWERLAYSWAIVGMLVLWLVFTIMLFIVEPLFLHAWFKKQALKNSDATFAWAHRLHLVLLLVSTLVIGAGALAAHGMLR